MIGNCKVYYSFDFLNLLFECFEVLVHLEYKIWILTLGHNIETVFRFQRIMSLCSIWKLKIPYVPDFPGNSKIRNSIVYYVLRIPQKNETNLHFRNSKGRLMQITGMSSQFLAIGCIWNAILTSLPLKTSSFKLLST